MAETGQASFRLRDGGLADAEAVLAVHRAAIEGLAREHYGIDEIASWLFGLDAERHVMSMIETGERYVVACAHDGAVIGFCAWQAETVRALYTEPRWVRRGVATALMAYAEAAIARDGHRRVLLGAALPGVPFYLARGYRIERAAPWRSRGGLELDGYDMCKDLSVE